ncbi:ABC transporter substrate-binding protein [Pelotomaculum propionicicum]|uniref:ABC transporter substrate-binding protein n=1 Tax=Pelotomaculum propionicicum TaxID=258475 RepID=UPI003B812D66
MNTRKSSLVLILTACLLVLLLVAGCAKDNPSGNGAGAPEKQGAVTVTDFIGRQVAVPDKVERIGCLYAFSGHVVAMLGRGDDIVAVVEGLKRDVIMRELYPGIGDALVPASGGAVNLEELIKARPDLVFIRTETAANEGEKSKLENSGIPYMVIDYRNMKEQMFIIEMIGQAVGEKERALKYNEYYQRCIDRVQERVKDIPLDERVRVYHSVNEATRTDARNTLPADWTQAAGAINVSVNEELKFLEDKYFAGLEQILLWDPDVIIVNEAGVADYIMTNTQWSSLSAVKNNKVYQMPVGISRWGHPGSLETPLAILWTAKTLYPELFSDIDLLAETKYFYREIFNYPISDQVAAQVLSGKGMRAPKGEGN